MDNYSSSAKSLIFAAIVFQAVFLVIGMLFIPFFAIASTSINGLTGAGTVTLSSPVFIPFFAIGILSIGFIFGILWILLDYFLLYKKIIEDKIEEAKSNSLVLGILQLLLGGLIPGILIIIAYTKLSDSINYGMKDKDDNNMF